MTSEMNITWTNEGVWYSTGDFSYFVANKTKPSFAVRNRHERRKAMKLHNDKSLITRSPESIKPA